ncbi:hypothetical protein KAU11_09500 [Candidatus Babeliales bacterium]|nr:hypothetical protein [Candidatus Babeliales bacterium]
MAKIDVLAEQTAFLLEKQKELFSVFSRGFKELNDLLVVEKEKAEVAKIGPALESFQQVQTLLDEQEKEIIDQGEQDIEFLEEQIKAIEQVKNLSDEKQAEELTGMMLEADKELSETKQFKADVEEEGREAQDGFRSMIDDITSVLQEEGITELAALLEAHKLAAQQEQACEDEECDEKTCEPSASCSGSGSDIFKGLEVEQEPDDDSEPEKTGNEKE